MKYEIHLKPFYLSQLHSSTVYVSFVNCKFRVFKFEKSNIIQIHCQNDVPCTLCNQSFISYISKMLEFQNLLFYLFSFFFFWKKKTKVTNKIINKNMLISQKDSTNLLDYFYKTKGLKKPKPIIEWDLPISMFITS